MRQDNLFRELIVDNFAGVEGSDAARYKLWGNGMALPNALYVMEGVAEAKSRRRNKNGIL